MNAREYIRFIKYARQFAYAYEHKPEVVLSEGKTSENFIENIETGLEEAKIFEISDDIKRLLALTNTPQKNEEIKLPFPYIFLDVAFTKKELKDLGIKTKKAQEIIGMLVTEGNLVVDNKFKENILKGMEEKKKEAKDILVDVTEKEVEEALEQLKVGKALRITMASVLDNGEFWFDTFNRNQSLNPLIKDWGVTVKEIKTTDKRARDFAHKFVLNFLNFLHNPEVEYVELKRSKKNKERRRKEGKIVIPSTNKIKIKGKLKRTINKITEGKDIGHYSHRFYVRGHFRTYRDDRYKNMKGKRQWIPPFIKGSGVLIDKSYLVNKNGEMEE